MADRYLLESGSPDGYLLEDSSGVLLLEGVDGPFTPSPCVTNLIVDRKKQLGYAFIAPNLILTTLTLAATLVEPRAPLAFTPQQKTQQVRVDITPNLLESTLGVTVSLPFVQQNAQAAPQSKRYVYVDQTSGSRIGQLLPDYLPVGSRLTDSVSPREYEVRADQAPNLLTTTLATVAESAVVRSPLSFVPQQKYQVTDWNKPSQLTLGLPIPSVEIPIGSHLDDSAPFTKRAVYADNWSSRLTTGIPAAVVDPIPVGKGVYDSAPPPKYNVGAPLLPGRVEQPTAVVEQPIGSRLDSSAPPPKFAVVADNWPSRLTTGIPVATVDPLPIGQRLDDSATPPKYNLRAPLFPERIEQPAAPAEAPFGTRLDVSAPYRKYQVQVDIYQNYLPLGIPPGYPASADFDPAPHKKRINSPEPPPNLNLTLLTYAPQPIPVGQRIFDSAPPRKSAVYAENLPSRLTTEIPPSAPIPIPVGKAVFDSAPRVVQTVIADVYPRLNQSTLFYVEALPPEGKQLFDSAPPRKSDVYDLNLLWPNSQLPAGIIPPLAQPPGQRVFDSAPPLKAPVWDVNYLWPNSLLPTRPAPAPVVPTVPQTPAGAAKKRHRYIVNIDGHEFIVASVEEARELLNRAKELAEEKAEKLAAAVVPAKSQRKTGRKPVTLQTPKISTPDKALVDVVSQARKDINKIYRDAAIDAELAVRLSKLVDEKLQDDDDDEAIMLLI